ncbi:enoyl-CoA hydratase [Rhodococcus opacus]|uniref:enoyl-CoA hydratase n=1 Tax=Rhodococcus TaxID=1827 RepID=UPI0002A45C49|nr:MULTISPECIES: enoyl-CoA hydratase [Rhodococcus]ELB94790.1 enoyl-CoA hydratase [Rhodococcus wratislaviensis IFP 2016]MDI9940090.1 enoyl-CoA hydratase [Rhodococcus sp. IEGM 1351]MDV6244733.1 enoyl-CoA hydratase [Rhodococcus opacus]MDX5965108.1 enoyl-CoA hydratase [Rhodococcus opacus]NKY74962.1 enoyl-CoA hydratase [Rhodococcus opacus]
MTSHSSTSGVVTALDADLLRVTLDRPARMNAVRIETLDAITDALESRAGDSAVRAAVLTGAGGAFCTGADLSTTTTNDRPTAATIDAATIDAANRTVAAIRAFPRPVVGAVNGPAAGVGVSLALACDLTVATKSSYFLVALTKVGLMPDGGATALVAASIGRARAMKMALLAERLPAREALTAGLIADVYSDDEFDSAVENLTCRLTNGPGDAFRWTKDAVNDATLTELDNAFARERNGQLELLASPDFEEGVTAFRKKRPAAFRRT